MKETNRTPSELNKEYWEERYRNQQTGWDVGYCSNPLQEYIDQLQDKTLRILIPGAGNAYEAEYLFKSGFTQVYVCDISEEAIRSFSKRLPEFPSSHLLLGDFFLLKEKFDLILEQTFFCALNPELRKDYVTKCCELLNPGSKLTGLLFNCEFEKAGPPFGGSVKEYRELLSPFFNIKTMENCYNSITPRKGNEVFFIAQKI